MSVLWTVTLVAPSFGCAADRAGMSDGLSVYSPRLDEVGSLPGGWTPLVTNGLPSSTTWRVIEDDAVESGCCLALVENHNGRAQFNLCVREEPWLADLDLRAACRGDFGVGVVWRCQDADNYYVCRVNPMEGNFNLYKVVAGKRTKLATERLNRFLDEQWYRLRVAVAGERINCYLDDRHMFEVRDRSIMDPGMIGVWTRADALGRFSDIEVCTNVNDAGGEG